MPLGWDAFPAFSNVRFDNPKAEATYETGKLKIAHNYTISQQGLTANVTCQKTSGSPLNMTYLGYVNSSIPGLTDGKLNIVNFTYTCPR